MSTSITVTLQTPDGSCPAHLWTPPAGRGPGLLLLLGAGPDEASRGCAAELAEEGYVVLACSAGEAAGTAAATAALHCLKGRAERDGGIAAIADGSAAATALELAASGALATLVVNEPEAVARPRPPCPVLAHLADGIASPPWASSAHVYPGSRAGFTRPDSPHYQRPAARMAYSRTLGALRAALGPRFDLSALWDAHTYHEFATRDVDATMATMVAEPYVNHIPTMTGGVGHDALKRFYKYHFVDANPPDTRLVPISRTIGVDRLVDEMVFCFTHTCEIPWMLPGVAPTGRYVEIPLVAIVNFRGDKLCHEHIYWDQASVLAQIGLLDTGHLPVAGVATARKLLDETLPSNVLMGAAWEASAGRPL